MSGIERLATRIRQLDPEEKQQLAGLLSDDQLLVDAIVRESYLMDSLDLLLKSHRRMAQLPMGRILREEIAFRKKKRDRKSDPETILRNVKICDAYREEPNKKKLARKYKVSDRYIRKVIDEEAHWREKAEQLHRK